jgi:hypothetical protein
MLKTVLMKIAGEDFNFENSLVRVVANRNFADMKLVGLDIGPFEEGNEYEVYFWVALELVESGIARFREDERLDASKLNKIQWTERIQPPGQISGLPEGFYPRLRRCLAELNEEMRKDPEKMREYERVRHLTYDVINSRLKKIVSIASAPAQTENVLRNLSDEEKFLYGRLYKIINRWKTEILEYEGKSDERRA